MPAIEAALSASPSAPTEVRNGSSPAVAGAKSTASEVPSNDAFIAALLAQASMPVANPELPPPLADAAVNGQDLPLARPALAALNTPRRAAMNATVEVLSGAVSSSDKAGDAVETDFAQAFAAMQDVLSGSPPKPLAAQDEADSGGAPKLDHIGQTLDTMAALHVPRGAEASPSSQAYVAKPAALPLDQPALFAERLNQHLSVMLTEHVQTAHLAVSPPELGPIEVRVTLVGDEVKIQLAASHAATREALNDALPRLRASFADSGISLGQASVFAQMPERQQSNPSFDPARGAADGDFERHHVTPSAVPRSVRIGLIDAFV